MITVEDMPLGTVGFTALGQVADQDYQDVLVPAPSQALAGEAVRLLYVLGSDFDTYSAGVRDGITAFA